MRKKILEILPDLRRFAFALTGTQHDADDLLQSTIERVLDKGVPAGVELPRWAFRVCRNLWIDETRKRRVRLTEDLDDLQDISHATDVNESEEQAFHRITLDQINDAMNLLPEAQRSTLSMLVLGGMAYADIAETLEIPVGTVMSRVARARRTLADQFPDALDNAGARNNGGGDHGLH
ncbi:MAG: RNA polymerase sigma factor [Gammaproteobacteria bacterium]|nr:RNA polymerase sigma factor [Gammaproteobacteria bacterium]